METVSDLCKKQETKLKYDASKKAKKLLYITYLPWVGNQIRKRPSF